MTQKGLITVIYQETSESRIYEIKNVESSEVLDFWTWEEFTIRYNYNYNIEDFI